MVLNPYPVSKIPKNEDNFTECLPKMSHGVSTNLRTSSMITIPRVHTCGPLDSFVVSNRNQLKIFHSNRTFKPKIYTIKRRGLSFEKK